MGQNNNLQVTPHVLYNSKNKQVYHQIIIYSSHDAMMKRCEFLVSESSEQ